MTEASDEEIDLIEEDPQEESDRELTIDDYAREKARREKAEKLLVEQKRRIKELESKDSQPSDDIMTKAEYAMEKFLDKNPELAEYTEELKAYQKKGLSLTEAKTLVLGSDKARENREKVNSLGLSDGEPGANKNSYTQEELAKMKPEQAQKIWAMASKGQVKVR